MTAATLGAIKEIFQSARDLEPAARNVYLDEICGSDALLRKEIDALLKSDQQAHDFMGDPPSQLAAELLAAGEPWSSDAGRVVGHYKLIEQIGTGGMGTVYLPDRADRQFEMGVTI